MINYKFIKFQDIKKLEISDEIYFGMTDYVSNSQMSLINPAQGGTPSNYHRGFSGGKKDAFIKGTAVHQLTLESDEYYLAKHNRPNGKLGDVADAIIKHRRNNLSIEESILRALVDADFFKGKYTKAVHEKVLTTAPYVISRLLSKSKDKQPVLIPEGEVDNVVGAVNSLKENKTVQSLLNPPGLGVYMESFQEDAIIGEAVIAVQLDINSEELTEMVIPVKAKIDNWLIDHKNKKVYLTDLKTTGKDVTTFGGYFSQEFGINNDGSFGYYDVYHTGSFLNFHYHRQAAFYGDMLEIYIKEALGSEYVLEKVYFMVVESFSSQPNSLVFEVGEQSYNRGVEDYQQLLARIAYHKHNGFKEPIELIQGNINLVL